MVNFSHYGLYFLLSDIHLRFIFIDVLPKLKYLPGLESWKVLDKDGIHYKSMAEVPESISVIRKSMFPPTEEELKQFHLKRCIRLMPHLQNTGKY